MLFPDSMSTRLRALLGARPGSGEAGDRHAARARRAALERRLLVEHQRRYGAATDRARRGTPALVLAARLALAGLVLTGAGVAACQIPVDVELELGRRYVFEVPAAHPEQIEALAGALEQASGADEISVRVAHEGGPTMAATVDLWGPALDLAAVERVLAEREIKATDVTPLDGAVRTTWGDRIGHELFDLELDLDAMNVDEARQAILDQLAEQGFRGEAEVEVEDLGDGKRRVEIRLEETEVADGHNPEPSP